MVSGAVPLTSCRGRYMPEKGGECARRRMPRAKSSVTVCVGNGAGPARAVPRSSFQTQEQWYAKNQPDTKP